MTEPFTKAEVKAVFKEKQLEISIAVKACLTRAAHYRRLLETCKQSYERVRINSEFTKQQLNNLQNKRCEWIFTAIDIAEEEATQHWRFIEDGEKYISWLIMKYQGDMAQCTDLEKAEYDNIQWIDEMSRRQQKGDWR